MKKMFYVVIAAIALLALLPVFKDLIIKSAVEKGVEMATGLRMSIGSLGVGIIKSAVSMKGLILYNPKGFEDEVMLIMPEIYVDYDPVSIMKGKVHLRQVRLYLKELTVVKNEKGELNLNALNVVKAIKESRRPQDGAGKMPEIQIDDLRLKADKAVYKDYSSGSPPSVREFAVYLDERYTNIRDPYSLVSLIIVRTLNNTAISGLAGFDIKSLSNTVSGTIAAAKNVAARAAGAAGAAGSAIKKTAEEIKKATEGLGKAFKLQ